MIKLMICESDDSLIDVKVQAVKNAKWEPSDKGFVGSGGPYGEYKLTVDGVGRAEITNFQDTMTVIVVSENEKYKESHLIQRLNGERDWINAQKEARSWAKDQLEKIAKEPFRTADYKDAINKASKEISIREPVKDGVEFYLKHGYSDNQIRRELGGYGYDPKYIKEIIDAIHVVKCYL